MAQRGSRGNRLFIRLAFLVASVTLIVVVTVVVIAKPHGSSSASCAAGPLTAVRGVIGSEKEAFFEDQRVSARFACAGLSVTVDASGSREMLNALKRPDHDGYGFAFPGSTATAKKIMNELAITDSFRPFSSPMTVATFKDVVDVLTKATIVQPASDGSMVVDVKALLAVARKGVLWDQLPGNDNPKTRWHKAVRLMTTDPQDSNSAIMFLSIASLVANGGPVVTTAEDVQKVLPDLCRLVIDQGEKPDTSQVLFDRYLVDGMGRIPMALIYEAQFVAEAPGQKPDLTPDMVLLYPRPTVYSEHTLIPLDDAGRRVGQVLRDDPELAHLAAEHGFRPARATDQPISSRRAPVDSVGSPSFEVLESMIASLKSTEANARPCA
ncbi:hypothetical protein [Frankia sp. Cr2]|uniref:hypothetical protein n=1 Tax=Frankia sp. Cr2 TaxID=3073932 RepID=UPI002AD50590|nr:hypothetical protein [Frankia sp. Cr2]